MFRRGLLALLIVYLPNALHVPFETGIPGVNLSNLLLVLVVMNLLISGRDTAWPTSDHGQLTLALSGLFAALIFGFVLAQVTLPVDLMADFTYLKNAIFYPLLYFVYRRCREDLLGIRQLIVLVLVVAAVAGLEAVREGLDYGMSAYSTGKRASGPFGVDWRQANAAGAFYAMFLPMFVAMALHLVSSRLWRLAALGGASILAIAIMVTYSRQAYLIGIIGVSLLLLRRSVVIATVAALAIFASASLLPNSVTQRVTETEQIDAQGQEALDTSTASRFVVWTGAAHMLGEHPAGVGLNRFKTYIGNYASYAGYDAHNIYVLTAAEMGPIGIIALLWTLWCLWRLAASMRNLATSTGSIEARALAAGFTVTVIATALGNLYGSFFFEGAVMGNFWILCGLLERYFAMTATVADLRFTDRSGNAASRIGERFPLATRALPRRYGRGSRGGGSERR